jgi:hypothetical protein
MLSNIHKHSFYKSEYGTIIENIMQYFTSWKKDKWVI